MASAENGINHNVGLTVEQTEAKNIRYKSEGPYQDYELGIGYLWDPISVKKPQTMKSTHPVC